MTATSADGLLDDELLERFRSRAAGYDAANAFPSDDFDELVARGYLRAAVPTEFGGLGLGLEVVAELQSRLASAAPATALAVNMHLVWTAAAAIVHARGESFLDVVLTDAGAGEVFAFGVSEPGNDLVLFDSVTSAVPIGDGGYAFAGTKISTSLSPVWTRLGLFGRDDTGGPDGTPVIVHGFLRRDEPGHTSLGDWDTVGMRATQSHTTLLDGAVVPASRIVRTLPVGPSADPLVFGIFAAFETLVAAVYRGVARRAVTLAVEAANGRTSRRSGAPIALDPVTRWRVADLWMALDGLEPQIDRVAQDLDALAGSAPDWFPRLVALKVRATEVAAAVVDGALTVAGGSSYRADSELGRLFRDVLAGRFHPSSSDSAHATVAQRLLGPLG
ncbi:acyl-CoA dehydrogenase family protein [Frondihabitans australicus]|uniref:Alkylation response protein AidB-like acyl-CoA dehydrogenase n=1 Tax=Frondihabitans australicus TaxID=386892 RepID=A0A495IG85_9MICO|nr:acyl-CoA dehydrogenase family protein [Frondihabitans australicus]RKR74215.1 alkylation response protein AidB-like acyl-CoA dehydrogenase [Frondihabitans australicus]